MQFETFFVPLRGGEGEKEALNAFLRSRRVLKVEHALAEGGWAFCVEWMEGNGGAAKGVEWRGGKGPKVDYREVLSPEEFAVFSRLREVRRGLAEGEGVQVYEVMTNEQLAEMVRRGVKNLSEMGRIEGVGEARLKKYGGAFLAALRGEGKLTQRPGGGREGEDADAVGGNTIRQEDGPDGAGPSPNAAGSRISERGEA